MTWKFLCTCITTNVGTAPSLHFFSNCCTAERERERDIKQCVRTRCVICGKGTAWFGFLLFLGIYLVYLPRIIYSLFKFCIEFAIVVKAKQSYSLTEHLSVEWNWTVGVRDPTPTIYFSSPVHSCHHFPLSPILGQFLDCKHGRGWGGRALFVECHSHRFT